MPRRRLLALLGLALALLATDVRPAAAQTEMTVLLPEMANRSEAFIHPAYGEVVAKIFEWDDIGGTATAFWRMEEQGVIDGLDCQITFRFADGSEESFTVGKLQSHSGDELWVMLANFGSRVPVKAKISSPYNAANMRHGYGVYDLVPIFGLVGAYSAECPDVTVMW